MAGIAGLTGIAAGTGGCALSAHHVAVPAARQQEDLRPMQLLQPVEHTSRRDAIVRLVGKGNVTCTGTLIADDRVLTAHHCVSLRDAKGRVLERDMAPEDIQVELGTDDFPWGEARVRAIVAPQCGYASGDGDIAILVLERHLIGMPTATVRIESAPEPNNQLSVFGFGHCALTEGETGSVVANEGGLPARARDDEGLNAKVAGIHLHPRDAGGIKDITPGQFTAVASICLGDSGGPVYSSREDLIGVVSARVRFGDDKKQDQGIFTRVDAWRQLFSAAQEISAGASPGELPPYGDCHAGAGAKPKAR